MKLYSSFVMHAYIDRKRNERPMGHITHVRNKFKSVNTFERNYDYINYTIKLAFKFRRRSLNFVKVLLQFCLLSPNVKRCGLSIWTNSNPLYPKMLFTKFAWDWPNGSIEDFKILSVQFYYFVSSPLGKRRGPFIWII